MLSEENTRSRVVRMSEISDKELDFVTEYLSAKHGASSVVEELAVEPLKPQAPDDLGERLRFIESALYGIIRQANNAIAEIRSIELKITKSKP